MSGKTFFVFLLVLSLVDYTVPYYLVGRIPSFLAAYLFWCLLALAMIVFAVFYTRPWSDR